MESNKGPSPWVGPSLAGLGIVVAIGWAYIQTVHWRKPDADYTAIVLSSVFTIILWVLLVVAAIINIRDAKRARAAMALSNDGLTNHERECGIIADFAAISVIDADYGSDQIRKPALEGLRKLFSNSELNGGARSIAVGTKGLVGEDPQVGAYKYLKVAFSLTLHEGKTLTIRPGERYLENSGTRPSLPAPNRGPNLKYQGFRISDLHLSRFDHDGVREPNNDQEIEHAVEGIVLKFENEPWPDGSGQDSSDLIARIVYRSKDDELKRMDYALWLNGRLRSHYIRVGETHEMLLFLRNEKAYSIFEDKRQMNKHFPDPWSWFRLEDISSLQSAEITITDHTSQARYVFNLDVTAETNGLSVRLRSPQ